MNKYLLTGGQGCLGSRLTGHLLDRGDQVVIYDPEPNTDRLKRVVGPDVLDRVALIKGDVTDYKPVRAAVEKHGVDIVVHLAALQVPLVKADPLKGCRVNTLGTAVVLQVARDCPQIKRSVCLSSAAVYGPNSLYGTDGTQISEDVPLQPATLYGTHKMQNEAAGRVYFTDYGVSSVFLRPWTVVGVGRDAGMTSTSTAAILHAVFGKDYKLAHGGKEDVNFLDDVVAAIQVTATAPFAKGYGVYNIPGHHVTATQFCAALTRVAATLGLPSASITPGEVQYTIASNLSFKRIQTDFPGVPLTPLDDIIRITAERFLKLKSEGLISLPS